MSHFYAAIPTSARRTIPTARGHTSTGISTFAASYAGRVAVRLYEKDGKDYFEVTMQPHLGAGDSMLLATGIVGERKSVIVKRGRAA